MEEYPKIIYKYRNWTDSYHKNTLLKAQVFLSKPKDFNDPFDTNIHKNHFLLDSEEKINFYADHQINKSKQYISDNGLNPDKEKANLLKRLKNLDKYQSDYEELEIEGLNKHFGILSLSKRWDSILMWSHYSNLHKGICIGFNENKMRNSSFFGRGGLVEYKNEFPIIEPTDENLMLNNFNQIYTKAEDWQYEEEYRLAKFNFPNELSEIDRLINLPIEFIDEVILGLKIPDAAKDEVLNFCFTHKISAYEIKKTPFAFQLERTLIPRSFILS